MEAPDAVLLAAVAFAAGGINAIAGGGTLVSFPGLLFVGYTSKVANVTNTVAVVPGFLGGSVAYRQELSRQRTNIIAVVPPALLGALAGAAILLATPESAFKVIVPFLILAACTLLAYQDRVGAYFRKGINAADAKPRWWLVRISVFCTAIYGAYFGAAMGIIILAVFGVFLP